jgi:hypothetical protein
MDENGWWRITPEGKDFCDGKHEIPEYVLTFRGKVVATEGKSLSISDLHEGYWKKPDYIENRENAGQDERLIFDAV